MCGICGQYNFAHRTPVDLEMIRRMASTITHRGPDDEGAYQDGELGFGFRRLSIIDLAGGHQPMSDAAGRVWIVFNGEIYNYPDLRRELESKGYVFHTRSDTESIIYGYKEWGVDVVDHLNGMFGFAVWDADRRRLLLARDRAGIKPIYYHLDQERLVFGSEIRPILANLQHKPEPDPVALNLFLKYRYTPAPLTLFKGIRKLAPGTRLIIEEGKARVERWWRFQPRPGAPISDADAEERLLELYKQAIERQLMSDVPLGLLLSGGMDSGLMLALMNLYGKDWPTFTVGFGQSYRDDELSDAAETARILKAPNHQVRIDRQVFEATLSKIINILEEPVASPSVVPMYFVSERARQDVKVALMGQGPDELFGGYRRHLGIRYGGLWRGAPAWVRRPLGAALSRIPRCEPIRRGLYALAEPDRLTRYQRTFEIAPGPVIDHLFQGGILNGDCDDALRQCWADLEPMMRGTDELGGLQFLEVRSSLPDELLMYADKISMHHALEVRVPYLDHDIIEFVEQLPASMKVRRGRRKWLHGRVCQHFLPAEIIHRKKRGFAATVVDDWFRLAMDGKMRHMMADDHSLMYEWLCYGKVQQLMADHRNGREDNHKLLFSLMVFEEWLRNYCD